MQAEFSGRGSHPTIPPSGSSSAPCAQIKTYVRVVFSKSTWLKGTIEKHTLAAVKDSQADFIVKAGQATGIHMSPFQVLGQHSLNPVNPSA